MTLKHFSEPASPWHQRRLAAAGSRASAGFFRFEQRSLRFSRSNFLNGRYHEKISFCVCYTKILNLKYNIKASPFHSQYCWKQAFLLIRENKNLHRDYIFSFIPLLTILGQRIEYSSTIYLKKNFNKHSKLLMTVAYLKRNIFLPFLAKLALMSKLHYLTDDTHCWEHP